MSTNTWKNYFDATRSRPPSKLVIDSLAFVNNKEEALDLGCGAMRDTKYLLSKGFHVTAVDSEEQILKEANVLNNDRVTSVVSRFDQYNFPKAKYDIVVAMSSLPFNDINTFTETFTKLIQSMKKGAVFCGSFFGPNDEWNKPGTNMTFLNRDEIKLLFKKFDILYFIEKEEDSKIASGAPKHWHIFYIIAKIK